mmetsp:Transcript_7954/g.12301  ORF Transcript_7954/g.12301 Transcript_7954/m.12301 type:complete len:80 (-) Transcript_7954:32-271(-)
MFSFDEFHPDSFTTMCLALDYFNPEAKVDQSSDVDFYFFMRDQNKKGCGLRMRVITENKLIAEGTLVNVFMYKPKQARM